MLPAARAFLHSLENLLQRRVLFPFADEERYRWNYLPGPRRGLPLRELNPIQRHAALALLESALSGDGFAKATGIMALESILAELEGRGPEDRVRDPEGYFFCLFGTPEPDVPWGWRIDGHHLSLTFTAVTGELIATTPAFMGANPAEVPHGPHQGQRILREEEDWARGFLHGLEGRQLQQAIIARHAPRDIITGTRRRIDLGEPIGLPAAELNPSQREALLQLVGLFARNFRMEYGEDQLGRLRQAGVERVHFAWAGGSEPGEGHYYRIHGPTLLIEYDNTQNNANHIHTVMRDPQGDFGLDLLRRHYQECNHHA